MIYPHPMDRAAATYRHWLIVMPNWVGDVVMATPLLRRMRERSPDDELTVLVRHHLKPLLCDCPWVDRILTWRRPAPDHLTTSHRRSDRALVARLRAADIHGALILPNSFRAAAMMKLADIPARVGYGRQLRSWMLTDRLAPPRDERGRLAPTSAVDYYLELVRLTGGTLPDHEPDRRPRIFTKPRHDEQVWSLINAAMHQVGLCTPLGHRPLVLLNPGASKPAKRWPAERFGAVGDALARQGAVVAVNGAPSERDTLDAVISSMAEPALDLSRHGMTLRQLKSVMRHAALLVTNDTGTRHIAAALGVPMVSLFGPTDPRWADVPGIIESQQIGPCDTPGSQALKGETTHESLLKVSVEQVAVAAADLLDQHHTPRRATVAG